MRKTFILCSALCAMMALSGCGAGTTKNATSSQLLQSLNNPNVQSALTNVITELLKNKTSEADINGKWTYTEPKIVFESDNLLNQLGASVASSKLESMLSKQLDKVGLSAGKSTLELKSDKTYIFTMGKKTYNGTYTYDAATSKLVLQGAMGLSTINCTATVKGNELYMLFEADKLLTFATGIAGTSSNLSTLSTLLKSYSGLKLGWTMKR